MAIVNNIKITCDLTEADAASKMYAADGKICMVKLATYLTSLAGGIESANVELALAAGVASGTVTLASVNVSDTVTIDGVVFTAVASGATGAQFNQGGTDTADAASLVTAINANSTLDGRVIATSSLGVVTITALEPGELGNSISLASSNGTRLAVSAAALSGGTNGTEYTFALGR
jgi:phage tail sheath gpL-like